MTLAALRSACRSLRDDLAELNGVLADAEAAANGTSPPRLLTVSQGIRLVNALTGFQQRLKALLSEIAESHDPQTNGSAG